MNRDHAVEELQEAAVKAKETRVAASRCGVKRKSNFVPEHGMKAHGRVEVNLHTFLTLRRLMSYIYGTPILDVSRSHTTKQHSR